MLRFSGSNSAPTWRPRALQEQPKSAQQPHKRAQEPPKTAQEPPKRRPRCPGAAQDLTRSRPGPPRSALDPTPYRRLEKNFPTSPRNPSELLSKPQSGRNQKRAAAVLSPRRSSIRQTTLVSHGRAQDREKNLLVLASKKP